MSYSGVVEVLLHLGTLRFCQPFTTGKFSLQVKLFHRSEKDSNKQYFGQPYLFVNSSDQGTHNHVLLPTSLQFPEFPIGTDVTTDQQMDPKSSIANIDLDGTCYFRMELPCYPRPWSEDIYLELSMARYHSLPVQTV